MPLGVEIPLEEYEVKPSPELEPDLPKVRDTSKAEALVQPNRGAVVCVDAGDHDVLAERRGSLQQRRDECGSNALPSSIGPHVY